MIIHSAHIISAITDIRTKVIESVPNGESEIVEIGVRFANKQVDKVQSTINDLIRTVWLIIDGKHEFITKHHKGQEQSSIFLQDKVGNLIYDSLVYRSGPDKDKLKKEKNTRVRNFNNLSDEDKAREVEITHAQIIGASSEELLKKEEEKPSSGWDDLPFLQTGNGL